MKTGTHPTYHADAKVICACGAVFTIGGTVAEIHTEVCSVCHPYYTGKQKLIDTAGKVEKFRAKMEAAKTTPVKTKKISEAVSAAAAKKGVRKQSAVASKLIVKKVKATAEKAALEAAKKTEAAAAAAEATPNSEAK